MKKLLAMVLVLGVASVASAALSLSGVPTDAMPGTYTISVLADDAASVSFGVGIDIPSYNAGIADLTDPVKGPATGGGLYAAVDYRGAGYAAWFISSETSPEGAVAPGERVSFSLVVAGDAGSTFDVLLYDAQLNVTETASVNVVPEPITMSLLGLGGLVALRRRNA